MSYISKFYLTGGVFFFLLKTTAIKKQSSRDRLAGKKEFHTDAQIMNDLLQIFTGIDFGCSSKEVSQYMNCIVNGSAGIPLTDVTQFGDLLIKIQNRYDDIIKGMKKFYCKLSESVEKRIPCRQYHIHY